MNDAAAPRDGEAATNAGSLAAHAPATATLAPTTLRILLVDSSGTSAAATLALLRECGYTVRSRAQPRQQARNAASATSRRAPPSRV
eukprot:363012-Chlamydomonas_euryale.AAC.7